MTFDVVLVKEANNGYIARPVLWPDSAVHGATEQEALRRVRVLIRDLVNRTQFVQVQVDVPKVQVGNPWLTKAGVFADDPTWDDFLQAMADYRQQLGDEQITALT
jgi:hypothetical protein